MTAEPVAIALNDAADVLTVEFDDGRRFDLDAEYLRVFSPSAEVQGHTPDQATLQTGKRMVTIKRVDPMGDYALSIKFSDAHSTGIYTWEYLYALGAERETRWADYLRRLEAAGASRDL
ncbi:MAG: DUF971 domain-containing protein [Myxococcota bacterium]